MTLKDYILQELQTGRTISRLTIYQETYKFKTPSRISDLRAEGHKIADKLITTTNLMGDRVSYKVYWMPQYKDPHADGIVKSLKDQSDFFGDRMDEPNHFTEADA